MGNTNQGAARKTFLNAPLPKTLQNQRKVNDIELLPIRIRHIFTLQNLAQHHGDPFDRLLIAQANIEQLMFITDDAKIRLYDVNTLW